MTFLVDCTVRRGTEMGLRVGIAAVFLFASAGYLHASCREGAELALVEVERDGGIEYETLKGLYDICLVDLRSGVISQNADTMVSEIGSYLDSWDALARMPGVPPSSMKDEMINNYPHIANMLQADLRKLLDRL
jgi:hypothetical protein